ncbi:MAG: ACT domain-containing protein [Acidobacteriota bacterium]|nr:ACT domain-containing protein [Acidobacteriota bacterium]
MCAASHAPSSEICESGWSAFRLEGPIPFATTGVLSSLSAPLAAAGIGLFVLSTYDTDVVLVKTADAARAESALEAAGFSFAARV